MKKDVGSSIKGVVVGLLVEIFGSNIVYMATWPILALLLGMLGYSEPEIDDAFSQDANFFFSQYIVQALAVSFSFLAGYVCASISLLYIWRSNIVLALFISGYSLYPYDFQDDTFFLIVSSLLSMALVLLGAKYRISKGYHKNSQAETRSISKFLWGIFWGLSILIFLGFCSTYIYVRYFSENSEPNWHIAENAVKSDSHPLAGFFKDRDCNDPWGWAIGPAGEKEYYISFCGPGGCFEENTYRPNTTIYNDQNYKVVSSDVIMFLSDGEWSTHVRCPSRT